MFAYLRSFVGEGQLDRGAALRLDQQHEPVAHRERLAGVAHGDAVDDLVRRRPREPPYDAPADPGGAVRVAVVRDRERDAAVPLEVPGLTRPLAGEERDAPVLDADPDRDG